MDFEKISLQHLVAVFLSCSTNAPDDSARYAESANFRRALGSDALAMQEVTGCGKTPKRASSKSCKASPMHQASPLASPIEKYTLLNIFVLPLSGTFFQYGVNLLQILKFGDMLRYPGPLEYDPAEPDGKDSSQMPVFGVMKLMDKLLKRSERVGTGAEKCY